MEPAYTTHADVGAFLGITIPADDQAKITAWAKAMSRYLDAKANRPLYRTEEETFLYDGDGTGITVITDCHSISQVEVEGLNISVADILEYPANKPYTSRIALRNGGRFPRGRQNISITAIHGMNEELPEDIKLAATILTAGVYAANCLPATAEEDQTVVSERIGDYQVQYAKPEHVSAFASVSAIIGGYTRIAL